VRPETEIAAGAVRRALGTARLGPREVSAKGVRDVVTDTDVAIEDALRSVLPGAVVGEERAGERGDGAYWLVDPICGTRNYASGIPLYCVNVALVEDGEVTVAVVGDGSTGSVLVAERGNGAWDGQRRLRASGESEVLIVEDGHSRGERRDRAASFAAAAVRADRWELRTLSTTLSLAYVAAGRVAAYVLFGCSPEHIGAGSLLAAEAGAVLTDVDGEPWTLDSDSLVASADPALHADLVGLLSEARR